MARRLPPALGGRGGRPRRPGEGSLVDTCPCQSREGGRGVRSSGARPGTLRESLHTALPWLQLGGNRCRSSSSGGSGQAGRGEGGPGNLGMEDVAVGAGRKVPGGHHRVAVEVVESPGSFPRVVPAVGEDEEIGQTLGRQLGELRLDRLGRRGLTVLVKGRFPVGESRQRLGQARPPSACGQARRAE